MALFPLSISFFNTLLYLSDFARFDETFYGPGKLCRFSLMTKSGTELDLGLLFICIAIFLSPLKQINIEISKTSLSNTTCPLQNLLITHALNSLLWYMNTRPKNTEKKALSCWFLLMWIDVSNEGRAGKIISLLTSKQPKPKGKFVLKVLNQCDGMSYWDWIYSY